jgi:hypothetical protein
VSEPKSVVYLTHQLGDKLEMDVGERGNNVANACAWVRWLVENTKWSINAAWLTNIMAMDDEFLRPRILMDQLVQLARSDAMIMVGGVISPHMRVEHTIATRRNIPIIDATELGRYPPVRGATPPDGTKEWTPWLLARSTGPIVASVSL